MYFSGPPLSGKTQNLVDAYLKYLNDGINIENILVISSNAYRKYDFLCRVKDKLTGGYPHFKIYTFHGIAYNTVRDFWPLLEAKLKGDPQIIPYLSGLESCEFLLKDCVREQNSKNKLEITFEDFYGDRSLISQLIRRYRLQTENQLSMNELLERSIISGQKYSIPANECLKCLKIKSSKIRVLDFVSQINAFNYLINNEEAVKKFFSNFTHLIVDDYDESATVCQNFIKLLIPSTKEFLMSFDPDGGTRRGYLGAYHHDWQEVINLKKQKLITLQSKANLKTQAENLFASIKSRSPGLLQDIKLKNTVNRIDMFENLKTTLNELIYEKEVSVEDIILVTPVLDSTTKIIIQEYCTKNSLKWQFLTGSNKPIDNPIVYSLLIIAQLINPHWNLIPNPYDIRIMLSFLLEIPPLIADQVAQQYEKIYKDNPILPNILLTDIKQEYKNKYKNLIETIEELKEKQYPLSEQLVNLFASIAAPVLHEDEPVEDFNRILNSLEDFLELMEKYDKNLSKKVSERDWLLQVKNEHVAENPVAPTDVMPNALVVATPQKVIDTELVSRYQIWLDVSSSGWTRTQTAALYNAWAYSKYYDGSEYDDIRFTHSLAAHQLRALIYYCTESIVALASNLDSTGNEQQGWLIKYLGRHTEKFVAQDPPKLRDDQKPILDYTSGTMAVAAVPGSGKTFVNVALIVKLIERGVNPESIMVLTYMDSAAQTLINRIKTIFPDLYVLPQISTIHGLAYKIIRDDDNLSKLNLPDDIDVADDTIKEELLNQITDQTLPDFDNFKNWRKHIESSISMAKGYKIRPRDIANFLQKHNYTQLRDFYKPYSLYCELLEHKGLIDFDDQIRFAIELLEQFPTVRQKYQQQFQYIIEDEAQDSTKLQQKMLSILTRGHNNYIRTGDINQAIMTTFTPVDVEGFKQFIKKADTTVMMDHSQRCAQPIYTMANDLIKWANKKEDLKNAFLDIQIKPVEGRNPEDKEEVYINILDNTTSEKELVTKEIFKLRNIMPAASYAVLVRSNADALSWTKHLDSQGLKCICFTDNIQQRKVFNLIHCFLKVLYKPYNNNYIRNYYESMITSSIIKRHPASWDFLKKLGSPFVSFDISELPTTQLAQFYIDILYWLENGCLTPSDLILKYSQEIFSDPIDRSNGYIISIMAEKYRRDQANIRYKDNFDDLITDKRKAENIKTAVGLPEIIKLFDDMVKMKKVKGYKFFEKEENDDSKAGFVQIMTVHKAKGQGFDIVFVPHVWEDRFSYTSELDKVHVDSLDRLEVQLMQMAGETVNKEDLEYRAKLNQIEENMRLLYVAITRAKRRLYITSSKKDNEYKKTKQPSHVLEYFINIKNNAMQDLAGKV